MNNLTLVISQHLYEVGGEMNCLTIIVDDMLFTDILYDFECSNFTDAVSRYAPIPINWTSRKKLLGMECDSDEVWGDDGYIQLLTCSCGTSDCWPFLLKVSRQNKTIIWRDFLNYQRSSFWEDDFDKDYPIWDYSGFGPFEFDLERYEEELGKIP